MKKIKIITGLAALATAGTTLGVLASCSCNPQTEDISVVIEGGGSYDKTRSKVELNKDSVIYLTPDEAKVFKDLKEVKVGDKTLTKDTDYKFEIIKNSTDYKLTIYAKAMTSNKIVVEIEYEKQVSGIQLSVTTKEIEVNGTFKIKATLLYSNADEKITWTQEPGTPAGAVSLSKTESTSGEEITITGKTAGYVALVASCKGKSERCAITVKDSAPEVTSITSAVFTGTSGKAGEAAPKEKFTSDKLKVKGKIGTGSEQDLTIGTNYIVKDHKSTDITAQIQAGTYELPESVETYTFTVIGVGQVAPTKAFTIKITEATFGKTEFLEKYKTYWKNFQDNKKLYPLNNIKTAKDHGTKATVSEVSNIWHYDEEAKEYIKALNIDGIDSSEFGIAGMHPDHLKDLPEASTTVTYTYDSTTGKITYVHTESNNEVDEKIEFNKYGQLTTYKTSDVDFEIEYDDTAQLLDARLAPKLSSTSSETILINEYKYVVNASNNIKPIINLTDTTCPTVNSVKINDKLLVKDTEYSVSSLGTEETEIKLNDFIDFKTSDQIEIDATTTTTTKTKIDWSNAEGLTSFGINIIKAGTTTEIDETSNTITLKYTSNFAESTVASVDYFESDISLVNTGGTTVFTSESIRVVDTNEQGLDSATISFKVTDFTKITAGETLKPLLRTPKKAPLNATIDLPNFGTGKTAMLIEGHKATPTIINNNSNDVYGSCYLYNDTKGIQITNPQDVTIKHGEEGTTLDITPDWTKISTNDSISIKFSCKGGKNLASVTIDSESLEGIEVTLPKEASEATDSVIWQQLSSYTFTAKNNTGEKVSVKAKLYEGADQRYETSPFEIEANEEKNIVIDTVNVDWANMEGHALALKIEPYSEYDYEYTADYNVDTENNPVESKESYEILTTRTGRIVIKCNTLTKNKKINYIKFYSTSKKATSYNWGYELYAPTFVSGNNVYYQVVDDPDESAPTYEGIKSKVFKLYKDKDFTIPWEFDDDNLNLVITFVTDTFPKTILGNSAVFKFVIYPAV